MEKIIVSGASGWLGRSTLNCLASRYKDSNSFKENVTLVSSSPKEIEGFPGVKTLTFSQAIERNQEFDGFVHLASLTKDKVSTMSHRDYLNEYLEITSSATQILQKTKKWFVFVSSGAVWASPNEILENSISKNPYGFLKRMEESHFKQVCSELKITLVCGRLWGGAGFDLLSPEKYAIGSLILNGLRNEDLFIRSNYKVFRRFTDTRVFMELCLRLAEKGVNKTFDSGGDLVEIQELAEMIRSNFPNNKIVRPQIELNYSDEYYSKSQDFENLLLENDLLHPNLVKIIQQTINGIKSRFIN